MNFEAPMTIQKAAHLLVFVRAVVVHDQVQFQIRLVFAIQPAQEFDELLVAVMRITLAAYLTAGCVERSKQGRCSVSDVVVRPGAAAAFFQRQTGLSAIQRLNLALFIDTEHDGVLGRIEIDPHHVEELFNELRVP